jgi:hypothetical protein
MKLLAIILALGSMVTTAAAQRSNAVAPDMVSCNQYVTKTVLTVSPDPASVGSTVMATATVTSNRGGTPSGVVQFTAGTTIIATVNLNSKGVASVSESTTGMAAGQYVITATFLGTATYASSNGSMTETLTSTVSAAPTTTTVTQNVVQGNTSVTDTVMANVVSASGTPTGNVTFNVTGPVTTSVTLPLSSGIAQTTFNFTVSGTYVITADYTGTTAYSPSVGTISDVVTIAPANPVATTSTLVAVPSSITAGQSTELTATVSAGNGTVPSGSVEFLSPTGTVLATEALSNGSAAFAYSQSTAGSYLLKAEYTGNSTYASSVSAPITVTVQASTNPTGTALSTCGDIIKSGVYYLAQNVSSAGTCFFIDADGITLNLNGFGVTYGTGGGTVGTPGILLADSWYTAPGYSLAKTGSTNKHGGFVMYGGSVTSATNAAPQSRGIWVGQSNDVSPAPTIHDVVFTTYAEDSNPIFATGSLSGFTIYNNTLAYMSVTTSSRYDFYGYALFIGDNLNSAGVIPDNIYNNKITNAPQGGIYDDHQNAVISQNDITFNSFYANDYCVIDYAGDGQQITNNVCHPASGRGIDVESKNVLVSGNTISVLELVQDAEYGGCEEGGTDGIRVRDNGNGGAGASGSGGNVTFPGNFKIQDNIINTSSTVCPGVGLRFTLLSTEDPGLIDSNSIDTTGSDTSTLTDYGVSFDQDYAAPLTWTNNTFTSSYAWFNVAWDGANMAVSNQQTYLGTPKYGIDNQNGGPGGVTPAGAAQSIIIANTSGYAVHCGGSASGTTAFGSTSETCGSANLSIGTAKLTAPKTNHYDRGPITKHQIPPSE